MVEELNTTKIWGSLMMVNGDSINVMDMVNSKMIQVKQYIRVSNECVFFIGGWLFDDMSGQGELLRNIPEDKEMKIDPSDLRQLKWMRYVGMMQRGGLD